MMKGHAIGILLCLIFLVVQEIDAKIMPDPQILNITSPFGDIILKGGMVAGSNLLLIGYPTDSAQYVMLVDTESFELLDQVQLSGSEFFYLADNGIVYDPSTEFFYIFYSFSESLSNPGQYSPGGVLQFQITNGRIGSMGQYTLTNNAPTVMLLSPVPYQINNGLIYFALFEEGLLPQAFAFDTSTLTTKFLSNLTDFSDGGDTSMVYISSLSDFAFISPRDANETDGDVLHIFHYDGHLLFNGTLGGMEGLSFGNIGQTFYGFISDPYGYSMMLVFDTSFTSKTYDIPSIPLLATNDMANNVFIISGIDEGYLFQQLPYSQASLDWHNVESTEVNIELGLTFMISGTDGSNIYAVSDGVVYRFAYV